jgi:hypothetical protein
MAVIVGLVFAGAMPVLFPLILAALIIRFYSLKYILLNANNPPKITDGLMARRIPTIIIVGIVVYTMNVIWALGVESIFDPKYNSFSSLGIDENSNAHTIPEAFLVFLRRVANSWPIFFIFLLGVVMILFHQKTSKIWMKIMRIVRKTSNEMN